MSSSPLEKVELAGTLSRYTHGENTVAVLIDFDNFYKHIADDDEMQWLHHEINKIISEALNISPLSQRIILRIYGGWLENGLWTRWASRLQKAIFSTSTFPIPHPYNKGILRGDITLVTRLLHLPDIEWGHTLRSKAGPPRLRLASNTPPEGCTTERATCPIRTLQHFTKKKGKACGVADCSVTNDQAFLVVEQKMVDTMMACDLLALCQAPETTAIMVLSNDTDLLPPLSMGAAISDKKLSLVNTRDQDRLSYTDTLKNLGVDIQTWGTR